MEVTEKLYYQNNLKLDFKTEIISCKKNENCTFNVILKETYFYPEGGGQPGDKGFINDIEVLDVQKVDNKIIHIINKPVLENRVKCSIDKNRRLYYMCQHTGQHLISAVLKREFDIDTKSVHLGEKITTIEVDKSDISNETLLEIENSCNSLIRENKKLISHFTDDENLHKFNIRRSSKVSGSIRVMEIEDYDWVPCGGVHLNRTGEIGLIKIINTEKIRGNIRIKFFIGENAYNDYQKKNKLILELNSELSTTDYEAMDGVNKLKSKISDLNLKLKESNTFLQKIILDELLNCDSPVKTFENMPKGIIQRILNDLKGKLDKPLLILEINDRVLWYLIDSKNSVIDFNDFKNKMLPIINGKGGGKEIWQGSGEKMKIMEFTEKTSNYLAVK